MLTGRELRDYRIRCGLSLRDVAAYCDVSHPLIEMVETGKKGLTEFNYKEIVKGINGAHFAKKNGTFKQTDKTAVNEDKENKSEINTPPKNKPIPKPKTKAGVDNK